MDVASGREPRTIAGLSNAVRFVAFSSGGRSVCQKRRYFIPRLGCGVRQSARRVVRSRPERLAVVDQQGRFDTNDLDGGAPLHWLVSDDPLHALPLEIFMRDYYTPRLLARIMNGEELPPIRSIAEIKNRVQPM